MMVVIATGIAIFDAQIFGIIFMRSLNHDGVLSIWNIISVLVMVQNLNHFSRATFISFAPSSFTLSLKHNRINWYFIILIIRINPCFLLFIWHNSHDHHWILSIRNIIRVIVMIFILCLGLKHNWILSLWNVFAIIFVISYLCLTNSLKHNGVCYKSDVISVKLVRDIRRLFKINGFHAK
jgi:hypothetical protein